MMALCTGYKHQHFLYHISHTSAENKTSNQTFLRAEDMLTSFQRPFDILSSPATGSMNTSLATRVSGIQIAHKRCTHTPSTVCLKAPPSLGQSAQDYPNSTRSFRYIYIYDVPLDSLVIQCISYTTTDPPGYTALHNNLDEPPNCSHHKKRWHYCSPLQSHHILRKSSLLKAWQSRALGCFWSDERPEV